MNKDEEIKTKETTVSDMASLECAITELTQRLVLIVDLSKEVFAILTEGNVPTMAVQEREVSTGFPERFVRMRDEVKTICHNTLAMEIQENLNKIKDKIKL